MPDIMDSPFDGRGARPAQAVRAPSPVVTWHRGPCGALSQVTFRFGAELVIVDGEDLDSLLRDARERANADPHCDKLPPDWAVIEAAMEGR